MKQILFACLALAFALSAHADTIIFKNGEELEGTVLEKDENAIKLQVEYGTVVVPMARVRRIDTDTPEKIAEREKKREEALEQEKEMKKEGLVKFKGKWVTPEEKAAAEEKLAEAKQKLKDAQDVARLKAATEAIAKQQAAIAAAAAKAAQNKTNNNNNNNTNNSRNSRYDQTHNTFGQNYNSGTSNNGTSTNGYRTGQ